MKLAWPETKKKKCSSLLSSIKQWNKTRFLIKLRCVWDRSIEKESTLQTIGYKIWLSSWHGSTVRNMKTAKKHTDYSSLCTIELSLYVRFITVCTGENSIHQIVFCDTYMLMSKLFVNFKIISRTNYSTSHASGHRIIQKFCPNCVKNRSLFRPI